MFDRVLHFTAYWSTLWLYLELLRFNLHFGSLIQFYTQSYRKHVWVYLDVKYVRCIVIVEAKRRHFRSQR